MSDFSTFGFLHLLFIHDDGVSACATAEYTPTLSLGPNVEDLRAERDHVDWEAVAACRCLRSEHTRIDTSTHAGNQLLGDSTSVALDLVSSPHAICSDNVGLFASLYTGEEGQMRAAVRVVFDSLHNVLAGQVPLVVYDSYPPLVPAASVPDCDPACVVPASEMLPLALNGELEVWSALPQMVVDGTLEVAQTGCAGLVRSQWDEFVLSRALCAGDTAISSDRGLQRRRRWLQIDSLGLCIGAGAQQGLAQAGGLEATYPGLQHGVEVCPRAGGAAPAGNGRRSDGCCCSDVTNNSQTALQAASAPKGGSPCSSCLRAWPSNALSASPVDVFHPPHRSCHSDSLLCLASLSLRSLGRRNLHALEAVFLLVSHVRAPSEASAQPSKFTSALRFWRESTDTLGGACHQNIHPHLSPSSQHLGAPPLALSPPPSLRIFELDLLPVLSATTGVALYGFVSLSPITTPRCRSPHSVSGSSIHASINRGSNRRIASSVPRIWMLLYCQPLLSTRLPSHALLSSANDLKQCIKTSPFYVYTPQSLVDLSEYLSSLDQYT